MKAYYSWAIILKEDDRLIGSIGYEKDPRRREINCLELGYALGEDCWGKGYMTEAANAALKHGFGALRLDMVSIYRNPEKLENRVAEKKRGEQYDRHRQVSGEVGLIPGRRRLITRHTNKDRNDPHRVDQGKQTNKKFKIRWKIKERLDHVLLRLYTCPGLTLCHEKSR